MSDDTNLNGEFLIQKIEAWERLNEEKKDISTSQKDIMSECKSMGYDPKIIKKLIALRKMEPHEREETDQMLALYAQAIGME